MTTLTRFQKSRLRKYLTGTSWAMVSKMRESGFDSRFAEICKGVDGSDVNAVMQRCGRSFSQDLWRTVRKVRGTMPSVVLEGFITTERHAANKLSARVGTEEDICSQSQSGVFWLVSRSVARDRNRRRATSCRSKNNVLGCSKRTPNVKCASFERN